MSWQKEAQDRADRAKAEFLSVTESLRTKYGVTEVTVYYSGSGDSGQIDDIFICGAKNEQLGDFEIDHPPISFGKTWNGKEWMPNVPRVRSFVSVLFEQWTDDILEAKHAGWEINDGADGHITFYVSDDPPRIEIEHNTYYTEAETEEYEL